MTNILTCSIDANMQAASRISMYNTGTSMLASTSTSIRTSTNIRINIFILALVLLVCIE